jgi:F-type H+-transporting ATPase subunit b
VEKLGINWGLLIAQIVNVGLLVWLLSRYLYRPVLNMLNERTRRIQESLRDADLVKEQLAHAKQDYDTELGGGGGGGGGGRSCG